MEQLLNKIFGAKIDVINYIKNEDWENASKFADWVCAKATIENQDWVWEDIMNPDTYSRREGWNATSYGNIAFMIYYAEQHNIREEERNYARTNLLRALN